MTQNQPAAAKAPKVETVADDMPARRVFDSTAEALAYLTASSTRYADFAEIPLAARGLTFDAESGEITFDPEVYAEGTQPMVATLKKQKGGVKAIVVTAIPTLAAILADEAGQDWLTKIAQKELNHVAVRALRDAEDIDTVVDQIPTTLGAYVNTGRADAGIMESFNELYKPINATMSKGLQVWAKARLIKSDLKKCFESKGFALEYYPALENRGEGKDSLFVKALQLGVAAAKQKGLDPSIFQRWIDTRAAKVFKPGEDQDEDELDIEGLTESLMTADDEDEAAPATEAETITETVTE